MAKALRAFLVEGRSRTGLAFSEGETIEQALLRIGRHPDAVVVLVGGRPVPEGEALRPGVEYVLVQVASGG